MKIIIFQDLEGCVATAVVDEFPSFYRLKVGRERAKMYYWTGDSAMLRGAEYRLYVQKKVLPVKRKK